MPSTPHCSTVLIHSTRLRRTKDLGCVVLGIWCHTGGSLRRVHPEIGCWFFPLLVVPLFCNPIYCFFSLLGYSFKNPFLLDFPVTSFSLYCLFPTFHINSSPLDCFSPLLVCLFTGLHFTNFPIAGFPLYWFPFYCGSPFICVPFQRFSPLQLFKIIGFPR